MIRAMDEIESKPSEVALAETPWLGDPALKAALERRPPDVLEVRAAAIALWRRSTRTPGGSELSAEDEAAAGQWLRSLGGRPGLEAIAFGLGGERARPYSYGFFADLSQKITWLMQRSCSICPEAPPAAPWFNSPLRLRPTSRQGITGADVEALRQRVQAAAGDHYAALFDRDLCIAMTFVLGARRSGILDVDNMAKTMCDALRGTVYKDDNQIQHLDLLKLRMVEDAEEWVHIRVRPTAVASHLDVFDRTTNHTFAVPKL
jgi:Holliday junction resolvase RusA-like endonuclease